LKNDFFKEALQMKKPNFVKDRLFSIIDDMAAHADPFVRNPGIDFSRNRKLPFDTLVKMLVSMGGNSLKKEMLDTFEYDENLATTSAFVQRREKILPIAFEHLLHEFTDSCSNTKKYRGYRLLAVDGSDLHTPTNPDDCATHYQGKSAPRGYNLLHLNALYDLCSRLYVDALIQPSRQINERRALIDMILRSKIQDGVIVIGDRGYESYNVLAHIERKGWKYLIRIKDNTKGIISGCCPPNTKEFDFSVSRLFTRKQTNEVKAHPELYKYFPTNAIFDFLELQNNEFYPMSFRIVRVKITDDLYETLITNLDPSAFPPYELKKLYHMRWGIETSFRALKHAVGLLNFHSKKREHIAQEVFARIIMYNFVEMITSHVVISLADTKHSYQVNFTVAIHICRRLLRLPSNAPPFDVEALIRINILPIRPGRQDKRNIRFRTAVSFIYRVA
jgi:hypothetical protein